jgi:hypothetical protein
MRLRHAPRKRASVSHRDLALGTEETERRMHDEHTREDVLLWLYDRLGKSVSVSIEVGPEDPRSPVLRTAGELRHWTQEAKAIHPHRRSK